MSIIDVTRGIWEMNRTRTLATLDEIAAHNFVLTPGRYVGAGEAEDDGEPFEEKFERLMGTLRDHFAEGRRLEAEIEARLGALGSALNSPGVSSSSPCSRNSAGYRVR